MHEFPMKPKERCSLGSDIRLISNHYTFQIQKPFCVNHYHIEIFVVLTDKVSNEETLKELKTREVAKYVNFFTKDAVFTVTIQLSI